MEGTVERTMTVQVIWKKRKKGEREGGGHILFPWITLVWALDRPVGFFKRTNQLLKDLWSLDGFTLPSETDRPVLSNSSLCASHSQQFSTGTGKGEMLICLAKQCYDPLECEQL